MSNLLPIYHRLESSDKLYTTEEMAKIAHTLPPVRVSITKEVKPSKAVYLQKEVTLLITHRGEALIQTETGKQPKWVDASMVTPSDNTKCG